jgi:hypothetical protein
MDCNRRGDAGITGVAQGFCDIERWLPPATEEPSIFWESSSTSQSLFLSFSSDESFWLWWDCEQSMSAIQIDLRSNLKCGIKK